MTAKTTRRSGRRPAAVTALVLTVAAACPLAAVADTSATAERSRTRALEAVAERAVAAGVPGVVVRVDNGRGAVVNVVRQGPWNTSDHVLRAGDAFRMASNTKTVTAALVLQLVGEHRLRLDDTVERWLPGVVPNGGAITLRMLLNHTGGLADSAYTAKSLNLMTGHDTSTTTAEEVLALGTDLPPVGAPGGTWSYSNPGYVALGMVLEKATGRTFADLVQQRVAGPLGMRDTYIATSAAPRRGTAPLAHGYEPDAAHLRPITEPLGLPEGWGFVGPADDEHVDTTAIDQSWGRAAAAIVSTAADWARFDKALMSGGLFPARLLAEMRATVPSEGPDHRYGLGVDEYRSPCGTVWGHDGALPGYRSDNYTDGTGRRTVSVLSTTHFGLVVSPEANAAEAELVDAAICAMLGKPVPNS
ncbi:serine hydrolase domain-containing protein [Umezawaea sp. Da 62-37]|uniref:serine hydrolase domain-containing protein n=1 Tax=Umezawaea sp. Da 62-37 TaxID=3075927 RepID=UPI0028F72BAC|nr:serine hydrolase domain-containing protein [Umezawaea sp. Da 62-37]WNV86905.1 serine hydrolase domain-containing protein [Umezawaea sp. Da 62-37]